MESWPLDGFCCGLKSHVEVQTSKVASNWTLSVGKAISKYWSYDQLVSLLKLPSAPVGETKPGHTDKAAFRTTGQPQRHRDNLISLSLHWNCSSQNGEDGDEDVGDICPWNESLDLYRYGAWGPGLPALDDVAPSGPCILTHWVPVCLCAQVFRCMTMTRLPWRRLSAPLWQKWIPSHWAPICFGRSEAQLKE